MMTFVLVFWIFVSLFIDARASVFVEYDEPKGIEYNQNSAPDKHSVGSMVKFVRDDECGICPTYFQKICAFDSVSNSTNIFDNNCIMDLYNCLEGTLFVQIKYDHCLFFGNFAYVHGFKYEDMDYGEDHIVVKGSKKNPDFVRRFSGLTENIFDFSD